MNARPFAIVLLCVFVMIDLAECRRPRRRKNRNRKTQQLPTVPTTPEITTQGHTTTTTTTPTPSTTEPMNAAGACRRICEGDSYMKEDLCTCGCHQPGYGYNSRIGFCEDIDECEDESMCRGGTCTNYVGSYNCICPSGYNLHANGKLCLPVPKVIPCRGLQCFDESSLDEDRCRCKCNNPGLVYDYFKEECVDIDECAEGIANCQHFCVNLMGSYQCQCNKNFRLNYDRESCEPIDPNCKDSAPWCEKLASALECFYNPSVRRMCHETCRVCVG